MAKRTPEELVNIILEEDLILDFETVIMGNNYYKYQIMELPSDCFFVENSEAFVGFPAFLDDEEYDFERIIQGEKQKFRKIECEMSKEDRMLFNKNRERLIVFIIMFNKSFSCELFLVDENEDIDEQRLLYEMKDVCEKLHIDTKGKLLKLLKDSYTIHKEMMGIENDFCLARDALEYDILPDLPF